jgi:large subunit ribosomal protein L19
MNKIMKEVEKSKIIVRDTSFGPGDTVQVAMKIREGDKDRIQNFQGVVIQLSGAGLGKTITVRKASGNVYVERIFPLNSPMVGEIKVVRKGRVRRAKLYYQRKRTGKSTRIKEAA